MGCIHRRPGRRRTCVPTVAFVLFGLAAGIVAFGRTRRLPAEPAGAAPITIVVPARNEHLSLGNLLGDLAGARPAGSRVIVVDDHSVDDTAAIAASHDFVEVVAAPELPSGWCGKPWACHTGAGLVDDGIIVFLDADVRVAPGALAAVAAETERAGGLVSVQPRHEVRRPYEHLSALFNVVALMGAGAGRRRPSGVFGPVLASSVLDYRASGGHAAVSGAVVEDLALADRYRDAGLAISLFVGGRDIRFRMYPRGLSQLVEGWTKNFASGAGATPPVRLALIAGWVSALVSITVNVGGSAAFAALYVLAVVQLAVLFRRVGNYSIATALAFPALVVFFVGVFAWSAYRTLVRRTVSWSGRDIAIPGRRRRLAEAG